ncbi:hypothetical protein [Bacillus sp. Marseille-P3661]|uniref:hypothetical protein n=1 Tax=Bacillus sp. Marseille-P3661 TaxID=1936234 RepID=UPI000C820E3D|nr:hypothetical protein [Bacillus sp. Marseille-P3661]
MDDLYMAFILYIMSIVLGSLISYKYGSYMIRKTGLFLSQTFIAVAIIIVIDVIAIIGWAYVSWSTNEFILVNGIVLGFGLLVISEVLMITILLIKRKEMIQIYNDSAK